MQNRLHIHETAVSCIKDIFVHSGKMKSIIRSWDLIIFKELSINPVWQIIVIVYFSFKVSNLSPMTFMQNCQCMELILSNLNLDCIRKWGDQTQLLWPWTRACRAGAVGGERLPQLSWSFSEFWQNMSVKFPDPILSVNLEYFIIKNEMQNSINVQSLRNQTFTGDDGI